jgi:hypothetical protein
LRAHVKINSVPYQSVRGTGVFFDDFVRDAETIIQAGFKGALGPSVTFFDTKF